MNRIYAAIDLKSFYASVECVERGLDPLKTNLVVADTSRTEKTICLAVSPSLKSFGIPGRARLFEVVRRVREINSERKRHAPGYKLSGSSANIDELKRDPSLSLDYIAAPPRMSHYMSVSGEIYKTYLQYISADDIHVYSIDEVFIDLTDYIRTYEMSAHDLVVKLIHEVFRRTGITATAGIGTNLYLAKAAMDIEAKHSEPDENGVRIAELDEMSYRRKLWNHRPITDFWRVGHGYAKKLAEKGLYTMGDIAKCSLGKKPDYYSEELLFKLFGVNAELLIDHAWGWEPCTIEAIKSYKTENNSISSGQVLKCPYSFEDTKIVIREMADSLALELVEKELITDQVVLSIGYDAENMDPDRNYNGAVKKDFYGRSVPKAAHGSQNLGRFTSSSRLISEAAVDLFDRIADRELLIRHIYVIFNHVIDKHEPADNLEPIQPDIFSLLDNKQNTNHSEEKSFKREEKLQKTILEIHKKFGKNAILKGTSLQENATQKERNEMIGGHHS